jgi:hypothetical protein
MSKRLLSAVCLLAVLVGRADAAALSTAAVTVEFNDRAECVIVNTSQRPIVVRSLELIGFLGDVFADATNVELAPRRTLKIFARSREHGSGNDPMFCQAQIGGPARSARLTICTGPEFERCTTVLD